MQELASKLDKPLRSEEEQCSFAAHQNERRDTGMLTGAVDHSLVRVLATYYTCT